MGNASFDYEKLNPFTYAGLDGLLLEEFVAMQPSDVAKHFRQNSVRWDPDK